MFICNILFLITISLFLFPGCAPVQKKAATQKSPTEMKELTPYFYYVQSNLMKKRAEMDKAVEMLGEAVSRDQGSVFLKTELAKLFIQQNDHKQALVVTKEILEELEKKGFKGRKIVEAGGIVQHFGVSPFQFVLEAMGSPIYSMQMAPYWNQILGFQQDYYPGYGQMLPSQNYQMWGSGFSMATLPTELGGQMPGAQGARMGGNPME